MRRRAFQSTNSDIAFAPNVISGTFDECYAPSAATPHDSGSDAMLSPLLEGSAGARRSGHSRKKPKNHIPRPPNVFILFCSSLIKRQRVESILRSRPTGPQCPL